MSSLPPQPEAGIKQFFLWALVAGFVPVLGLPVVWGLVALGWRRQASPAFRLWSRRLLALAVLDTLVAAACLHLGTTAARNKMERDEARLGVGLMSVDASSHAPPPLRLFEPSKQDEPVLPRELGLRKEWIGTGLAMVALLVLWGVGRKRGAGRHPLEVLAVLVVAGLGALATVRGLSALFGGPSRGVLLLGVWAQGLILLFAAGPLARRGAPGPDVAAGRGWGQTYLLSLGLLITLGMRTMMLMVWLSQVSSATPEQNMHPLVEMAREGPLGVWGWVLLAVPAALLAPVSEELLFRGALLPWLRGWMGHGAALVVSAGIFASLHLFYGVFAVWIFFLGLVLGWARLSGGELRAPILLHVTINSFALLMLARSLA